MRAREQIERQRLDQNGPHTKPKSLFRKTLRPDYSLNSH